jgi:hypothetical protein
VTPHEEYRIRLESRREAHRRLSVTDASYSYVRLGTFAAAIALGFAARSALVSRWILLAPAALFAWLIRRHDQVISARDQAQRAIDFYERAVSRLEDRWMNGGETGERFAAPGHPYAADLDLFGTGSLFQLLSIARTRIGEDILAGWLTTPADAATIRARQEAITELTPQLDLREAVALAGVDVRAGVDAAALVAWAEQPPLLRSSWMRVAAPLVTAATAAGAFIYGQSGDPALLGSAFLLGLVLFMPRRGRIQQVLHAASGWSRDLDIVAHVLDRLAPARFTSAQLAALRDRLEASGASGAAIRRLHRLVEMHDWQHNLIFAVISIPLLWDVHIAFAMEAWRKRHGAQVRAWLDSIGEFEALSSLATYRYEHPDDVFPAILESDIARYEGRDLGHPLLPAARMIRNDVTIGGDTQLLVISGSNMSGKSTLLRTVGINAVLALAGAPVRAASLSLTPVALGATLRIQDSLQEGRSRFFAEITRIRELVDIAAGRPPLLFLLDELFHGTNSHDRLVGATGVLAQLLGRGAIGLITTHDLALTAVAEQLAPRAVNVHFEDRFEGGEILFDYRMKPGPVTRSNAIALMRAVGLDVNQS